MYKITLPLSLGWIVWSTLTFADPEISESQCVCGNGIQEIFPQSVAPCPYKLYGATAAGPTGISNLVYLNPYDGTGSIIAPISSNVRSVNGLDFSPTGVLYAVGRDTTGTQAVLATINCETGAATIIGNIDSTQPNLTDINFDSQGRLWTHMTGTPVLIRQDGLLGTINIATADFTAIGFTERNNIGNGISFEDFPNNVLYLADNIDLDILSQITGVATLVAPLLFSEPVHNRPRINGMDFDVLNNIMYVSINDRAPGSGSPQEGYLATINLSDGTVSFVKLPPNMAPAGLSAVTINRPYETCDQGGIPENNPPLPDGTSCSLNCALLEIGCDDDSDNDFDGFFDCSDPDCDGQPCIAGDGCTEGDACSGGVCVAGTPIDCNDFNDCTDDSCNQGTCINDIDTTNACDDFNPCTSDSCDETGFCVGETLADGTPCDDESACTTNDMCQEGQCVGEKVAEICNDGIDNNCDGLIDGADPECAGPVTIEDICDDGIDNDGDLLTDCEDPDCDGLVCVDEGNTCTDDICTLFMCDHFPDNSNSCTDGNDCTDDACIAGSCVGTNDNTNTCDDLDACTLSDQCSGGVCGGTPMVCDDSEVCTSDFCVDGSCSFAPLTGPACSADTNSCTDDVCDAGVCTHPNDNTNTCTDGLACTSSDHCVSGSCTGTPGVETGVKCSNGIDDDCDFLIDSQDPNCSSLWLRVFVTKNTFSPNFGSATAADAVCQAAAVAASRTGTFKAFISSSTSNAASRITNAPGRPWYMYSAIPARIADNLTDLLDGTIQQAINVDEFGADIGNPKFAWTGSKTNGTVQPSNTCNDWTTTQANVKGTRGAADKIDAQWVNQPDATCNQSYRLYCFQIVP